MWEFYTQLVHVEEAFKNLYTQPEPELQILLTQLRLCLPGQPPPRMVVNTDMA
jgi:hypothetical protein